MTSDESIDLMRRFGGLQRLYGETITKKFAQAHIFIAGIGGVGSWIAESLARCGIGILTLADLDHIAESNINRQVHALSNTLGQAKTSAMQQRIKLINPTCQVNEYEDFVEADYATSIINHYQPDICIDATDQANAKIAMLLACKKQKIPFLMCGGAGGKTDPFSLRFGDLSEAKMDALLNRIRQILRQRYDFPKGSDTHGKALKKPPKMGVSCFWFEQKAILPTNRQACDIHTPQGLSCAGYGSCVTVTATMGLAVANQAIKILQSQIT